MRLISHRGNLTGPNLEQENHPKYIDQAISSNFDVEVDIWLTEGVYSLGHDNPQYAITQEWLNKRKNYLWIHCKNLEAAEKFNLIEGFNYFWHEDDVMVLTSKNYIWSTHQVKNGILVMPETFSTSPLPETLGVCSDYISNYK